MKPVRDLTISPQPPSKRQSYRMGCEQPPVWIDSKHDLQRPATSVARDRQEFSLFRGYSATKVPKPTM